MQTLSGITISMGLAILLLSQKGNIVYEYNPFKNYRMDSSTSDGLPPYSLLDLDTEDLKFDLNHPVDMAILPSYDGSVNIILNDGINLPRMINSRFSLTGKDTYLIVDRNGDNDTNLYDHESFDTDISLYKKATTIAKVNFIGESSGGNLPVGNYHFYFKLADSDGNETDFIGESGLVTCYIGNLNDPLSILGGIRNLSSFKAVHFKLSNLDASYDHVVTYYTRYTSDNLANKTTEAFKILKDFPIYSRKCDVRINGYEEKLEVSINDINTLYNLIQSANTQEIAQNMLFMGNVNKLEIPYKELADLSLRFYPTTYQSDDIGFVNQLYKDPTGKFEYYNVQNIYNKLGYWDDEIYRFGIVYILNDYSLSPVFNIRGRNIIDQNSDNNNTKFNVYLGGSSDIRNYIPIDRLSFAIDIDNNCKGVGRIQAGSPQILNGKVLPIGIKIEANDWTNLYRELKKYVVGFFFVRQKRVATTLCLAVSIGLEGTSHLPTAPVRDTTLNNKTGYLMESFLNKDKLLIHDFNGRKVIIAPDSGIKECRAAICPEFELNSGFYNQFFTGGEFKTKISSSNLTNNYCDLNGTHLYNLSYGDRASSDRGQTRDFRIVSLLDSQALAKNKNELYSALAGTAEEVFRVSYYKYKNPSKNATNLLRGAYGPYLGLEGHESFPSPMTLFDIKIPNYSEGSMNEYFQIRYLDSSPFEPISERLELEEFTKNKICYRGDCFIGNFTHRMVRNFADPSAPYNDDIINSKIWAEEMNLEDSDTYDKVNRGDVNAVKMGHWITVKVCSNTNLSLRSVDHSFASEEGITNKPRAFYPLYAMNTSGENKVPESGVYNDGYSTTISSKYNYEMPDVPAIKNTFVTRIMYSVVATNDAFRNGFRVFDLTSYRDYTLTYGALTRLVELKGSLLAVFEHGVCLIPVNERAIAGRGAGGNVFINTSSVLPENPLVLSDMFGTLWPESVIKTPYYVYGVDTVGKKIWRTNGQDFTVISDFRVEKFLIDNISLTEFEKTPIIGLKNVKSHYNAFKSDVMFTFYDDINVIEELVWNLCFNELLQQFTTFYSWVPSYSANVDNIFFSFDRTTSKIIAKSTSYYADIVLENGNQLKVNRDGNYEFEPYNENGNSSKYYDILNGWINLTTAGTALLNSLGYLTLGIKATMVQTGLPTEEIESKIVGGVIYGTVVICTNTYLSSLKTNFWKHGQAGLMKHEKIKPCFWYGKLHPFEFEFVVMDLPGMHKIFNNLQIISNKAQPESFHFEVVGETYDWAYDKLNMYCRLEATKLLFQRLGSNIKYNPNYKDLTPKQQKIIGSTYNMKSTYFPLYYKRIDTIDDIYDSYTKMLLSGEYSNTKPPRDYSHLSGSEIVYDPQLNEFRVWTHIGCCPIDGYYDKEISLADYNYIVAHFAPTHRRVFAWQEDDGSTKYYERIFYGRIKGNSEYKEDKWYVLIPSITFMLKNEATWSKPPIIINSSELPSDILRTLIDSSTLPDGYTLDDITVLPNTFDRGDAYPPTIGGWTARKETKLRDKYMKVRVRYKGDDLAIISAIKTIYTESYA